MGERRGGGSDGRRRCLVYTRRSVLDDGKSVGDQAHEGRADCAALSWSVAGVYQDNGRSASEFARRDREDWDRLTSDLRAGRGDALWLWEASRGDRKLTEWSALLDYCHAEGVLIHVSSHERTYDMANDRDWETLAEEGIRSAAESKKISKRVRRGTAGSIRKGKPIGTVPYGYRRMYDPETKKLVAQEPDPATAPVVTEIVKKVAQSKALVGIARELNERGVPSPGGTVWSASTVRKVAVNEAYVARRTHNGETHAGQWPALVDEVTFAAARRVVDGRAGQGKKADRPGRIRYELSGIAVCDVCSVGLAVNTGTQRRAHYLCRDGARHVSVGMAELDGYVWRLVVGRLSSPEVYERMTAPDDARAVEARRTVAGLREQLEGFYDAAADGKLTPAGLARVEERLLPRIAAAEKEAATVAVPLVVVGLVEGTTGEADVRARWELLPVTARRDVCRTLFAQVRIKPAGGKRGVAGVIDPARVVVTWRTFATDDGDADDADREEETA